jgi:antitoxin component of MazEF toxin-antitoxin module
MKSRLVRIGNSRGVRLPKAIIAQAGLTDEVELGVRDGAIIIARATAARSGCVSVKTTGCLIHLFPPSLTRRSGSGDD